MTQAASTTAPEEAVRQVRQRTRVLILVVVLFILTLYAALGTTTHLAPVRGGDQPSPTRRPAPVASKPPRAERGQEVEEEQEPTWDDAAHDAQRQQPTRYVLKPGGIATAAPLPPHRQVSWGSRHERIAAASIARLVEGEGLTDFYQIHHGIYRCVGAQSTVKFALKTECRPAQKWHGQQGWPEVAVYHLSRLLFGDGRNTVPAAMGMVVRLNSAQKALVHRDGCGLDFGKRDGLLRDAALKVLDTTKEAPLIGVALEWRPEHSDEALDRVIKKLDLERWFRAGTLSRHEVPSAQRAESAELVMQVSDIMLFDYLAANEDREEKNWFIVAAPGSGVPLAEALAKPTEHNVRFVSMDNGWAFIGREYKTSMCSVDRLNLQCPPLLRHLSGSGHCASKKKTLDPPVHAQSHHNCRFRRSTIDRLRGLMNNNDERVVVDSDAEVVPTWESVRAAWLETLARDPLVAWLLEQYAIDVKAAHDGGSYSHFSVAFARYVQGCPLSEADAAKYFHAGGYLMREEGDPAHRDRAAHALLNWLADGVAARAQALLAHVDQCVDRFGDSTVFMTG
jgi:hypothetical protein